MISLVQPDSCKNLLTRCTSHTYSVPMPQDGGRKSYGQRTVLHYGLAGRSRDSQTLLSWPSPLPGRLFCNSRHRRGRHDTEDSNLVRDPFEAKLEPAELDLRPGMVGIVLLPSDCCLAGLAARQLSRCHDAADLVRRPTGPQRVLVVHLLRV